MNHTRVIRRLVAGTLIASVSGLNVAGADQPSARTASHLRPHAAPAPVPKGHGSPAPSTSVQVLKQPTHATPSSLEQVLKRSPRKPSPLGLSSNSVPAQIECCTTWNSAKGTTGCATFAGSTCPDYAPFEAY